MGGACVLVDVEAVGAGVDHMGIGAQGVKNSLGDGPGSAVGAVQGHLHAPEGIHALGDQIAHVAVAARHIVHGAADMVPFCEGDLLIGPAEKLQLAVQVGFDQGDGIFVHLFAGAVEELDAVVIVGVVAGGDHDAAVEFIHSGHVGDRGGGGHVEQVGVRAGCHHAAHQGILEHVAGSSGILADDDAGRLLLAVHPSQLAVVPAQEAADLIGVIGGQSHICFPAEAVCSKIFTHTFPFLYTDPSVKDAAPAGPGPVPGMAGLSAGCDQLKLKIF